jgi:clan AA aspartic protease
MMTGTVSRRHALLPVTFRLPMPRDLTLEFVVDTGFTDFLTLPPAAVAAMALPFVRRESATLADGGPVEFGIHSATIVWNGVERDVPVLALGQRPLLGTALLDGNELVAQFTDGGLVTIDRL